MPIDDMPSTEKPGSSLPWSREEGKLYRLFTAYGGGVKVADYAKVSNYCQQRISSSLMESTLVPYLEGLRKQEAEGVPQEEPTPSSTPDTQRADSGGGDDARGD